ncbi:hypothetical protein V1290_000003 [Bradyrhizobium sp. AZCC 1578]
MIEYEPADENAERTKRIRSWAPNARILVPKPSGCRFCGAAVAIPCIEEKESERCMDWSTQSSGNQKSEA